MACLEARCPSCNTLEFGNDRLEIAKCPKCGSLTYITHDEYGHVNNPLEGVVVCQKNNTKM